MEHTLTNYNGLQIVAPEADLSADRQALNDNFKTLADAIAVGVQNPMTSNLDAGGYQITDLGGLSVNSEAVTSLDGGAITTSGGGILRADSVVAGATGTWAHCFYFDGTAYAQVSNAALNDWTYQTVCFWVRSLPDSTTFAGRIIEKGANSEWVIGLNNTGIVNSLFVADGAGSVRITSSHPVADGDWHFVVVELDISSGTAMNCSVWVDNQPTPDTGSGVIGSTTQPLNLARYSGGGPYTLTGWLNEVLIFNRLLTTSEISYLWNGGAGRRGDTSTGPWDSGLEVGWHLDDGAGGTFADFGPNALNLTVSGDINWVTPGSPVTAAYCLQALGPASLDSGAITTDGVGTLCLHPQSTPPDPVSGGVYFDGTNFNFCADGSTWVALTLP